MKINSDFKDIMVINEKGFIEYFNIGNLDFFDLKPESLLEKKPWQLYTNMDKKDSTLYRAIKYSENNVGLVQTLVTRKDKTIRQSSDTFCIKSKGEVVGAVEFAYYDENKDVIKSSKKKTKKADISVSLEEIIGECPEMKEFKRKVKKIIDLESPVLITGKTGTGKEMAARAIHSSSKRASHSFVYINCNSMPENLLEGLLFGTKKGSFTDAEDKTGLFQLADKGTIFLDEIDSIPLSVQGKLLKVIEDKCIRPIGAGEEIYLDVRIITSCNIGIEQLIMENKLRKDLFFRLSVIQFHLPELKKRGRDILLIANYYIGKFNKEYNKSVIGISQDCKEKLMNYSWPGNIRELRNLLESVYHTLGEDIIESDDIKERISCEDIASGKEEWNIFKKSGVDLRSYLEYCEKEEVEKALNQSNGNIKNVVKQLGISRQLTINKLEKYNLKYFT